MQVPQDPAKDAPRNMPSSSALSSSPTLVAAHEISEKKADASLPPIDGGYQAWGALLGSFIAFVMSFGLVSAFGVLEEYYVAHLLLHKAVSSSSDVAWIGSTQCFFMLGGGLVFGVAFDRVGSQPIMIVGSVSFVIACMLTSLCHEWYQLFLSQAIFLGLAIAALFTPPLAIVIQWFDRRRGMALGILTSGASLGGVIWPIALRRLLNEVGFAWTWRIMGFISIPLLIPVCIFSKNRLPSSKPKEILNLPAFRNPGFSFLFLAQMFNYFGLFFPYFYLPTLGVEYGLSDDMASYSLSILFAASLFGRIIPGAVADIIGRFNILFFSALSSGIVIFTALSLSSGAGVIILGAFYGFFSGSVVGIQGACIPIVSDDPTLIGTNIGMLLATISVPALLGSPIAGWLVSYRHGSFDAAIIFAGSVMIAGSVFLLFAKLSVNRNLFAKV